MNRPFTEADAQKVAHRLAVPLAALRAVSDVESKGRGFFPDGRAVICFERHVFWRQLQSYGLPPKPLSRGSPNLVARTPGGYRGGVAEYARLAAARQIHPRAADESTSWGLFQVMGYHWPALGYPSLSDFVARMQTSEAEQWEALVRYLQRRPALIQALQTQRWARFARGYNGPNYARDGYHLKLAHAWAKYSVPPSKNAGAYG